MHYVGVLCIVHFQAKRLGLKGVPEEEIPKLFEVIKKGSTRYTLGPGRAFGEMSFIDMPLRTASVRTVEPTRLLMLSRRDFLQIVRQDNALGSKVQWQMLRQLARILRGSTE